MLRLINVDELNRKIDEETYRAISEQNWDMSMALFKVKLMVGDMQIFNAEDDEGEIGLTQEVEAQSVVS